MGLYKKFVSQTRKPEGTLGKMMVNGMNSGHAKMADWGISHLPKSEPSKILELGCGGGRNAGELANRFPSARVTAIDYSEVSVAKSKEYNKDLIASGRMSVKQGDVSDLRLPLTPMISRPHLRLSISGPVSKSVLPKSTEFLRPAVFS